MCFMALWIPGTARRVGILFGRKASLLRRRGPCRGTSFQNRMKQTRKVPYRRFSNGQICADLTGMRFGRLLALEYVGHKKWKCRCICGKVGIYRKDKLRNGCTRSCGCIRRERTRDMNKKRTQDLTGQTFGFWKVLKMEYRPCNIRWKCRCRCGTIKNVMHCRLLSGRTNSCGCRLRKRKIQDLSGKRFGDLTVISLFSKTPLRWNCRCVCGTELLRLGVSLRRSNWPNCGCANKISVNSRTMYRTKRFCARIGIPFTLEALRLWLERQVLLRQLDVLQSTAVVAERAS
jgi:hypothetical protein